MDNNPEILHTESVNQFAFNTDGSQYGKLSSSHSSQTATGIGNGGEILGFVLPLDKTLKKIKPLNGYTPQKFQAAILEFTAEGGETVRVLAVANDTGGRHAPDKYNRELGELGVNTWLAIQPNYPEIKLKRNSLSLPPDLHLQYQFLNAKVRNVQQYRELKTKLMNQGRL